MKRVRSVAFIGLLLMLITGCKAELDMPSSTITDIPESTITSKPNEDDKQGEDDVVTDMTTYIADKAHVKALGRTYLDDDVLWCALSGSGAEFILNGTKASVTIVGDSIALKKGNDDQYARVAIYVNDERVIDDMMDEAEKTYTVFESDTAEEVRIRVVKLSESAMSTFGIGGIHVAAEDVIQPAEQKEMLIEFIGDSITCGYGVDDEVKEHPFSTQTEDVTKTYAYKTAEAFDADYSMVSFSGYGIISGYSGDGKKQGTQIVPKHYDKVGFSYGNMKGKQISTVQWDFNTRQPDLIVVNLGTNDDSYCQADNEKQQEYATEYAYFLKEIKKYNPDARILCTLGIMGGRLYPYVEQAVQEYSAETGDMNIWTMKYDEQLVSDGYAADWHPTEATHTKAAEKLIAKIKEIEEEMYLTHVQYKIALSFDDGPNQTTTVEMLDMLEKHGVVATFFVIGNNVNDTTADVVKRAYDMGCEIANHSQTHSDMTTLTAEEMISEIQYTSDKVEEIIGEPTRFFRPPYISVNDLMLETIDLPFICGIGANDWEDQISAEERAKRILEQAKDGSITLLHDMQGNSKTVEALDTIIPELKKRGFEFVTVAELFDSMEVDTSNKYIYSNALQTGKY